MCVCVWRLAHSYFVCVCVCVCVCVWRLAHSCFFVCFYVCCILHPSSCAYFCLIRTAVHEGRCRVSRAVTRLLLASVLPCVPRSSNSLQAVLAPLPYHTNCLVCIIVLFFFLLSFLFLFFFAFCSACSSRGFSSQMKTLLKNRESV